MSANGGEGVLDQQGGNVIEGNYFGTDVTGLLDRGNGDEGVDLNNAPATIVRGNVISGNGGEGMQILGSNGAVITGNLIGVGADGTTPIGNTFDGITVNFGPTDGLRIGGTSAGDGNTIAHNGDEGVTIFEAGSDDNTILGNSIHSNSALGIDHGGAGISTNDANDTDTGPNDGLNFPVITGNGSPRSTSASTFRRGTTSSRPSATLGQRTRPATARARSRSGSIRSLTPDRAPRRSPAASAGSRRAAT